MNKSNYSAKHTETIPAFPAVVRRIPMIKPLTASLIVALATASAGMASGAPAQPQNSSPHYPSTSLPVTSCADDGDSGTLRSVIASAQSGDSVDLTQLTCGTITLLSGQVAVHVADLTILGPGQDALTIDANYAGRVFLHDGAGTLTLADVTLAHGRADSVTANPSTALGAAGGCVLSQSASIALVDATVTACQAVHSPNTGGTAALGGGIYARKSITLTHSTVSNNSVVGVGPGGTGGAGVHARGGGTYTHSGTVSLTDSVISGNSATTGDPTAIHDAIGGGIYTVYGITAANSLVENNFAGCDVALSACRSVRGGGIAVNGNSISISSSVVSNNTASGTGKTVGGGIYTNSWYNVDTAINDSTISGNHATSSGSQAQGGGLFTWGGSPTLSGSTVSENSATYGGGIFAGYDKLTVVNCTISTNSADTGGGIFLANAQGYYPTQPMLIRNTTITANTTTNAGAGGVIDTHTTGGSSTFQSTLIAGNITSSSSAADLTVSLGMISGANNLIVSAHNVLLPPDTLSADPLLGPLADNGGLTFTHALSAGSPAIDTGSNLSSLDFDQRGSGFPRVVGPSADIGAFEYKAPLPPVLTKSFRPSTILAGDTSLLTITLANGNEIAGTLIADVIDALPTPVVVADSPNASTTCPNGVVTATPGAATVTLATGAGIPIADSCTVTVSVTANDEGVYTNMLPVGALQTDLGENTDAATAELAVTVLNHAPVATNDSYTTAENMTLKVSAPGILANDSDADGDVLTTVLIAEPAHGTLTLGEDGGFVYVPAAGFVGTDAFVYEANDGQVNSNAATVAIKVAASNQPPVAENDNYTTAENTALTVKAPGLLANDVDPDGDTLLVVLRTNPMNGTLSMNSGGGFVYTPVKDFVGIDSFTYEANDGQSNSNVATATITVTQDNVIFADGFEGL